MLKYLVPVLAGLLWVTTACASAPVEVPEGQMAVSESERESVVVGIVMGIDIAGAHQGLPTMDKESWYRFITIFDEVTKGCTTTGCITDRVAKVRLDVMLKSQARKPL